MRQTVVQEASSIRFGSGKFEVYNHDISDYVDLGAMRDIVFEETWEKVTVESDNAGPIRVGIRNHRAALAGDLMEINLHNLYIMRGGETPGGGLDDYDTTAASPVTEDQVVLQGSWGWEKFIPLKNQMHDGSEPTINDVDGSTDPGLVEGDDWNTVCVNGKWGIVIHEDGTLTTTENQNITIGYTVTPAASRTLTSGGFININPIAVRVTNTDENGDEFRITVHKAEVENGINIALQPDEGEDPAVTPIRLEGTNDLSRTRGDRLFEIYDSQHA